MLKPDDDGRFDAKCALCTRASPVLAGPLKEAETRLSQLGWGEGFGGQWYCPICTTRTTTKQRPIA